MDRDQTFVVVVAADDVQRVQMTLDGRLMGARRSAPYTFKFSWDPQRNHEVRVEAILGNGNRLVQELKFGGLTADLVEDVRSTYLFPYVETGSEQPYAWQLEGEGVQPHQLRVLDIADYPLQINIVLDISGSMKPFRQDLVSGMFRLLTYLRTAQGRAQWVIFDERPQTVDLARVNEERDLLSLFQSRGKSVVLDSVSASIELFDRSPRRVIVLLSDGADDGSRLGYSHVAELLEHSGASLIWMKTPQLDDREMRKLTQASGGFVITGYGPEAWSLLLQRLSSQSGLAVDDVEGSFELSIKKNRIWYPQWWRR